MTLAQFSGNDARPGQICCWEFLDHLFGEDFHLSPGISASKKVELRHFLINLLQFVYTLVSNLSFMSFQVCDHTVIGRVRIKRVLNPSSLFDRSTYLRAETEAIEDSDGEADCWKLEGEVRLQETSSIQHPASPSIIQLSVLAVWRCWMVLGVFGPNGGCIQLGSRQNPPWGQVMDFLRKLVPLYNVPCIQIECDLGRGNSAWLQCSRS